MTRNARVTLGLPRMACAPVAICRGRCRDDFDPMTATSNVRFRSEDHFPEAHPDAVRDHGYPGRYEGTRFLHGQDKALTHRCRRPLRRGEGLAVTPKRLARRAGPSSDLPAGGALRATLDLHREYSDRGLPGTK